MSSGSGPQGQLDAEELLHLALGAMEDDRDEDAMSCLKRALVLEPDNGLLHHLLGAVYAEVGMIDRAIREMTRAIECAPQLQIARFQLGMLHFTSGNLQQAESVWQPFADLPAENPLRAFRSGLLHLAQDEFAACVADLKRGLELNTEHPSLNHDMAMLIEMAEKAINEEAGTGSAPSAEPAPELPAAQHVLLSGYQRDKK